ncbi:MAG: cation-translocating P-type ATPase [Desulfobacteraceae bacterium]|nr:cation-translocating P-type ATPase [Desulfobacteraceae bacterium]
MIGRFSELGTYRELVNPWDLARVAAGGLLALVGYLIGDSLYDGFDTWLMAASVAVNGLPIVIDAFRGLMQKKVNVDELVSLAIAASVLTGDFLSAAIVSFVMVLGSLVEEATGESARRAIRSLIDLSPKSATVIVEDKEQQTPVADIRAGDILLVKPGERIPVDAAVVSGMTAVDESSITGEPIPAEKTAGDEVYCGTLNQGGAIRIRATKVGADTTLGKVIELVTQAEAHKPESLALIDRYAQWFTPVILLCAAATWLWTGAIDRAITVLIVGCPCALILAAPTAIVAAISRAAKNGILVKGGQYLERVADTRIILFDKTGTLTEGDPKVGTVYAAAGHEENEVLRQAACIEQNSTHPLARAVLKAARYAGITVRAAENLVTEIGLGVTGCIDGCQVEVGSAYMGGGSAALPGALRGHLDTIEQTGATPLIVYRDKRPMGVISVSDHVRTDAAAALAKLKKQGIETLGIVSGDHEQSVRRVGEAVGTTRYWFGLKPDQKLEIIHQLRKEAPGSAIAFVGDGINDAPALAAADVGIAMGAKGTEVALETADIALMRDDLAQLPFLIGLGKKTVTIIKWNIAFGLIFNLIAVIAGGGGLLSPVMGAVVHNIGSVLVVLSSASLALSRTGNK